MMLKPNTLQLLEVARTGSPHKRIVEFLRHTKDGQRYERRQRKVRRLVARQLREARAREGAAAVRLARRYGWGNPDRRD